jgi:uncharacterized membrane protein (DUF485 family)
MNLTAQDPMTHADAHHPRREPVKLPDAHPTHEPVASPAAGIDWEAAIASPSFRALRRSRQHFVVPAAVGAFAWITLWLVLVAYAPKLMGERIAPGVSLMYAMGLSQFALAWALAWRYLRLSAGRWTTLRHRAIADVEARRAEVS